MDYSLIFYGKLSPFLQRVRDAVEANEDYMSFSVDTLSEYKQSIGVMAGEGQKALTLFSQMRLMAECYDAGKEYFDRGSSIGLLTGQSASIHPLLSKSDSNISFFKEENGVDSLLEKIDIFFAMGAISVDPTKAGKEIGVINKVIGGSNKFDFNSRQRIERLGFLRPDPVPRKLRQDTVNELKLGRSIKSVDMFSRTQYIDIKNPSIDRSVSRYLAQGKAYEYTEESLKKDPSAIEYLEAEEQIFYPPECGMMKYFSLFAEMLGKDDLQKEVIFKLAELILTKEFNCSLVFHIIKGAKVRRMDGADLEEAQKDPEYWNIKEPNWEDETFEAEENLFTYPYYFAGQCLGFAAVEFKGSKHKAGKINHMKSAAIESVLAACKGAYKGLEAKS